MLLYESLPSSVTWKEMEIPLNLSFDRVLHLYDLWKDTSLIENEKLDITLMILIKDESDLQKVRRLPIREQSALFEQIYKEFISPPEKNNTSTSPRLFDFNEDGDFIFSSFWMDYGIDLIEAQGELDWRKFLSLFQGLSKNTKIKEVMSIRARPIPSPTPYNQQEIQELQELKRYYALSSTTREDNNFEDAIERLFSALETRARR